MSIYISTRPAEGFKEIKEAAKNELNAVKNKIEEKIDPVGLFIDHVKDKLKATTKEKMKELFREAKEKDGLAHKIEPFTDYIVGIMKEEIHVLTKNIDKQVKNLCDRLADGVISILDNFMKMPIFLEFKPVEFVLKKPIHDGIDKVCIKQIAEIVQN